METWRVNRSLVANNYQLEESTDLMNDPESRSSVNLKGPLQYLQSNINIKKKKTRKTILQQSM